MTRYTNYVMRNNVFAELETPIGSLATTIQLKDGQGARWGNDFPILATLENFDSNGKCTKREIVQITARSGDYLTVVRGYAPCPSSDDSNSQGTSTYSFGTDDKISLYITKEHFDKVDDGFTNTNEEIDDLHENGTDELRTYKTTGLGIQIKPGKVLVGSAYYNFAGGTLTLTDNATNYIEIDKDGNLVANTTGRGSKNAKISIVTTSGGEITSIEDWRLGTVGGEIGGVNIHDLTAKTSLSANDEILVADSDNIYNNKKILYSNAVKINGLTQKNSVVDNDILLLGDSAGNRASKKISINIIKEFIKKEIPMPFYYGNVDSSSGITYHIQLGEGPFYFLMSQNSQYYQKFSKTQGAQNTNIGQVTISTIMSGTQYGYKGGIANGEIYLSGRRTSDNMIFVVKQSIYGNFSNSASDWTAVTNYTISSGLSSMISDVDGTYIYGIRSTTVIERLNLTTKAVQTKTVTGNIYKIAVNDEGKIAVLRYENSSYYCYLDIYNSWSGGVVKTIRLSNGTSSNYTFGSYASIAFIGDWIYADFQASSTHLMYPFYCVIGL